MHQERPLFLSDQVPREEPGSLTPTSRASDRVAPLSQFLGLAAPIITTRVPRDGSVEADLLFSGSSAGPCFHSGSPPPCSLLAASLCTLPLHRFLTSGQECRSVGR